MTKLKREIRYDSLTKGNCSLFYFDVRMSILALFWEQKTVELVGIVNRCFVNCVLVFYGGGVEMKVSGNSLWFFGKLSWDLRGESGYINHERYK